MVSNGPDANEEARAHVRAYYSGHWRLIADAAAAATYDARSFLALAYAGIGDKEKALEQARPGVADDEKDAVDQSQSPKPIARQVLAQFGEVDAAIADRSAPA